MTVYIVTDLGYGDSGKGTTVDYLARKSHSLVVRHNGGPQAGHNVVTPDGMHHEFSQFGSGTFAGAQTYLSSHMLINPIDMMREALHLTQECGQQDLWSRTFVDAEARIITPWHCALNRQREHVRGDDRHGSCGRGVGELMAQDLDVPELTIRVKDIRRFGLLRLLQNMRDYLWEEARSLDSETTDLLFENQTLASDLGGKYHDWYNRINVIEDINWLSSAALNKDIIFEGAQGVLLDEWYGFHPYTTWSTTTHENALSLLVEADYDGPLTRLGVTRAYMTRHGAGPFVTEDEELHFDEPHNNHGTWQGAFRQGHLDLLMLQYALDACDGVDGLVVTHLDRADYWRVADRYNFGWLDNWEVEKIVFKASHNLRDQGDLTHLLFSATPIFNGDTVDTDELLNLLGRYAPIHLTSHGPTHPDKREVKEEALV